MPKIVKHKYRKEKHIQEKYTKQNKLYFRIYIVFKDSTGNRQSYSKNIIAADYRSPKEALDAACVIRDKILTEIHKGRYVKHTPTVEQVYKQYHQIFRFSLKTKKKHDYYFSAGIQGEYGNKEIDTLKIADIMKSLNLFAEEHSQKDVNDFLSLWRGLYKTCAMLELPINDKTIAIEAPKSKKTIKRKDVIISEDQFVEYLYNLLLYNSGTTVGRHRSFSIYYMLMIMWYTGLRPQEVLALGKDSIDFNKQIIHVHRSVGSTTTEKRQLIITKTETSIRDMPISRGLNDVLKDLLAWSDTDPLLADVDGLPYEIDIISDYISRVSRKCGIPFNAYMLRHGFSTNLFEKKENTRVIQDLMGHSSAAMSLDYARSNADERKAAMDGRVLKVHITPKDIE